MSQKLVQKYSEENYDTKEAVSKDLDHYMIDTVWQEIQNYRSCFAHKLRFNTKSYYITYNPYTYQQIIQCHQKAMQLGRMNPNYQLPDFYTEETQPILKSMLIHGEVHHQLDPIYIKMNVLKELHIEIDQGLLSILFDEKEDLFLRIYLILHELSLYECQILFAILLSHSHQEYLFQIIDITHFHHIMMDIPKNEDLTYAFLNLLSKFNLIFSDLMLSYTSTQNRDLKLLGLKELQKRYPMLNDDQLRFYIKHQKLDHYYTIQDYMHFAHVCYETARYSLDKIVEQQWYQKQKVGKKFVYYVM